MAHQADTTELKLQEIQKDMAAVHSKLGALFAGLNRALGGIEFHLRNIDERLRETKR